MYFIKTTPPQSSSPHMSGTTSTPNDAQSQSPNKEDLLQPHACVACAQRKVKCNKKVPCAPCVKSRVECIYRAPPPPQRRKRKLAGAEQALLDRVRSYEERLKSAGLPFDAFDVSTVDDGRKERDERGTSVEGNASERLPSAQVIFEPGGTVASVKMDPGTFVQEAGGQKFYEHSLLANLSKEFNKDPREFAAELASRSEDPSASYLSHETTNNLLASSLIVGQASANQPPSHPPTSTVEQLWRIFQHNVQPLTKLLHPPSLGQVVLAGPLGQDQLPKSREALLFAIYACAIMSITEEECQTTFGEPKSTLLVRYQSATRHILLNATFLKTGSLEMLQAFVLLLTSMQDSCDLWSLWILLGVAIRMAQSQGLHRDGETFNLSFFEVEMRRRLWFYVVVFNTRCTETTGFSPSILPQSWDTLLPRNLNDSDISPQMATRPNERVGATDMTFCLFRYQTAKYLLQNNLRLAPGAGWFAPNPNPITAEQEQQARDRKIADLESLLENKFLRFCDPVIPLHVLTTTMARSMLCKLRHMECHRRYLIDKKKAMSVEDRGQMMEFSMRNLAYDNMLHSTRSMRGFLWLVHFHFPWGAPIFALKGLAAHPDWSEQGESAWQLMEEQHLHHPEYSENKKAMNIIIGDLTLKTWAEREAFLMSQSGTKAREPEFIRQLRLRRHPVASKMVDDAVIELPQPPPSTSGFDQVADGGWDPAIFGFDIAGMDFGGLDWSQWSAVPADFE